MDDRVQRLESAIEAIQTSVAGLQDRISALELGERPSRADLDDTTPGPGDPVSSSEIDTQLAAVTGTSTLVGRSLLVLAGAFLLRALTEKGTFAPATGVTIGVAYAVTWIVVAALAAKKGSRASAGFYAVCSAVIAGPLLYEAATSFGVLSPPASVTALAGVTIAGLFVSIRWRLQTTAWVFTVTCLVTAAAVATAKPPGEAATAAVLVLGLATLWFAGKFQWNGLKWLTAFSADLAVLRLTAIATAAGDRTAGIGLLHPTVVASMQAILVVGFVGTFVCRSLRGKAPIRMFEFAQTAAVWMVGWGGVHRLAGVNGWSTDWLVFLALTGGVAAYAGAFGVVDRKQGKNAAFVYLSSLGLGLILIALPGVAGGATAVVWASLAVAAAAGGSRWDRVTLRVHAAILLVAAWAASGVVTEAMTELGGGGTVTAAPRAESILVVLLTLAATVVVVAQPRHRSGGWMQRVPLTGLLLLSTLAIATVIVEATEALLPHGSAGATATVALSMVTVALAILARRWGIREAGWLVYPLLMATGLRMVVRDLLSGETLVLVIALAAYGFGLIVSTKLVGIGIGSADT